MADFTLTQAKKQLASVLQNAQAGRRVRVTRRGAVIFDSESDVIYPPRAGEPLNPKIVEAMRADMKATTRKDAGDYIRRAREAARR